MSAIAHTTEHAQVGIRRAATWLVALPPWRVLAVFVLAQWLVVLGIALAVRRAGWIYYQGGDQLWYWTAAWLHGHGQFPQPGVGYLWSFVLIPFALAGGPNLVQAFPGLILFQTIVLLPIAVLCIYGIALRLAGRLFAYWAALVWVFLPLVGIWFTDAGYHARFTEALLPQGLGLTAMGDFPGMLAALVSLYFLVRSLSGDPTWLPDAVTAGVAAGASVAVKPSNALFLFGPAAAFVVARRWRPTLAFVVGLAPAVIALTFIKWWGFSYLPLLNSQTGVRVASGVHGSPVLGIGFRNYLPFDWHVFVTQLDQVREHFWSVRLVEWLVVGGAIAVIRLSRPAGTLIVAAFAAIVILKTGSGRGDFEGGSLLRLLMPAYPSFVLMLAALPFLVPRLPQRARGESPGRVLLSPRARWTTIGAAVVLTAVVPVAVYAAETPVRDSNLSAAILVQPPILLDVDLGLQAEPASGAVRLHWRAQHPLGGPVFYHVFRRATADPFTICSPAPRAERCQLELTDLGTTRAPTFVDEQPLKTPATYYVGVAADWLNDTAQGDVYFLSRGAAAR